MPYACQHRDAGVVNHVIERNVFGAGNGEPPVGDVSAFARKRELAGAHLIATLDKQAMAIEGVDTLARLILGEAFLAHGRNEQVDDAHAAEPEP